MRHKQAEKVANSDVNLVGNSIAVVDTLDKYEVKPELMDILRKIVSVHGDIVQNSTISTIKYRSMYLEVIGDMIIELQEKHFAETDDDRLQDMMVILDDMKHKKVNVEWLLQKFVEILEARQVFKHSMMLKEKRECNTRFIKNVEQELKEKEEEIEAMKAKLQSLYDEKSVCKKKLDRAREESSNITKSLEDDNAKMKSFQNFSLVNGLYLG
ncbi:putative phospholipase [Lupinus albus]|uniref:Putative phospholipase n=1 Tax=Lupinus albus TaxID=3870 RepID=A0A6A4PMS4_LUPAL|nr:putative phospholipase [Lupinus albus]